MATSSLQQNKDICALDLNLSLGGVFSLPKGSCEINEDNPPLDPPSKRSGRRVLPSPSSSPTKPESPHQFAVDYCMKDAYHDTAKRTPAALQSQDIKQQKRARGSSDSSSVITSADSGSLSIKASCRGNPEHSSRRHLDRDQMDMHLIRPRDDASHHSMKKATMADQVPCGFEIPRKSTLHRQVQSISSSRSHPISGVQYTQASPSNTPSAHSPTSKASDPLSSQLSLQIGPCLPASDHALIVAGTTPFIHHARKSSIGDHDGKICHSSSSTELENGDNLEDEGTYTQKKVTELEAPRSRCGSNSDMIGLMGPLAATPTTNCSSMVYTHAASATLPVQGPFALPIQWGLPLRYAMPYSSHALPPNTSFPCISFVPDSASIHQPEELAASYEEHKLRKNQEASSKLDQNLTICGLALTRPDLPRDIKNVQDVPRKTEVPAALVHDPMPGSVSEVCTSASSLKPVSSMSPTANCSSEARTSPWQPLTSETLPAMNDSSDSLMQVDPAGEACRPHAGSNPSPTQALCSRSLCPQKSNDSGITINKLCGQNKHSGAPGRKPMKTVRFSSHDLVKAVTSENQTLESSSSLNKSGSKSQSVEKLHTWQEKASHNCVHPNVSILTRRTAQECEEEEESAISKITSENSDQGDSVPTKVKATRMLAGQNTVTLPRVSTTCLGPNGKTIHGVMYITKTKQACLICSCHGKHMSPSEFVQHSGSTDLTNPERRIVVTGFSCVKQVV